MADLGPLDTTYAQCKALDLDYATLRSPGRDLAVTLRTVPAMLVQRGI